MATIRNTPQSITGLAAFIAACDRPLHERATSTTPSNHCMGESPRDHSTPDSADAKFRGEGVA